MVCLGLFECPLSILTLLVMVPNSSEVFDKHEIGFWPLFILYYHLTQQVEADVGLFSIGNIVGFNQVESLRELDLITELLG